MAKFIINSLEIVKIHHNGCEYMVILLHRAGEFVKDGFHTAPVQKARKAIMGRHVDQFPIHFLQTAVCLLQFFRRSGYEGGQTLYSSHGFRLENDTLR